MAKVALTIHQIICDWPNVTEGASGRATRIHFFFQDQCLEKCSGPDSICDGSPKICLDHKISVIKIIVYGITILRTLSPSPLPCQLISYELSRVKHR